jgi:hypothetical protein
MEIGRGTCGQEHALLDNLLGRPVEDFRKVRQVAAIMSLLEAVPIWENAIDAHKAVRETGATGLLLVQPLALHISLVAEMLLHSVVRVIALEHDRATAIRFIKDCWIGKGVEALREQFPEVRINVVVQDVGPVVPPVPPSQVG